MEIDKSRLRTNLPQIGEHNPIDRFMLTQQEIPTLRHKMKRITICVVQLSQDSSLMW